MNVQFTIGSFTLTVSNLSMNQLVELLLALQNGPTFNSQPSLLGGK